MCVKMNICKTRNIRVRRFIHIQYNELGAEKDYGFVEGEVLTEQVRTIC